MAREIKFKAWHKELKKMFTPEEMGIDQLTIMPDGRGFANISSASTKLSEIDNGRLMIPLQFTGLHDKNNKEVYQGDIPERDSWIDWCDKCCSFELFLVDFGCSGCSRDVQWNEIVEDKNLVIIGNIYENPELTLQ